MLFPLIVAGQLAICHYTDDVIKPGATGDAVIKDVLRLIKESDIFPDDHNFLSRLARVNSKCVGTIDELRGGLWQIGEGAFAATQDTEKYPQLKKKYVKIKDQFDIDWPTVTYDELSKPLYSAMAGRLFISAMPKPMPTHVRGQANFWKLYNMTVYNPGAERCFIDVASTVRGDPHVSQMVFGSDKSFCYDVYGDDGDIFSFFVEPNLDLKVNARLASVNKNKIAKFVWDMAVFTGTLSIYINPQRATVNSRPYDWNVHVDTYLTEDHDVFLSIDDSGLKIDFEGLIWITVKRLGGQNKTHMDFGIHHIGDIEKGAGGILGDVSQNVAISEIQKNAFLQVNNLNETIEPLKLFDQGRCWKLRGTLVQGFNKLILRNKISCLSC